MKDPTIQLEQLRRNSLLGPSDLKLPSRKSIPDRKMPGTVASVPEEALAEPTGPLDAGVPEALPLLVGGEEAAKVKDAVAFNEPDFGAAD